MGPPGLPRLLRYPAGRGAGNPGHVQSLMLVGHNPGMEDLVLSLVPDDGSSPLRDLVEEKFPTASLAVLAWDSDNWADLREGGARLVQFTRPRDLDPALGQSMRITEEARS